MFVLEGVKRALSERSSDLTTFMISKKRTYPFAVDAHFGIHVNPTVCNFRNALDPLHVRSITTSPKDDGDLGSWIHIVRRDERPSRVVDQSRQLNAKLLQYLLLNITATPESGKWTDVFFERFPKHPGDVLPFRVRGSETFSPPYKLPVVNPVLPEKFR